MRKEVNPWIHSTNPRFILLLSVLNYVAFESPEGPSEWRGDLLGRRILEWFVDCWGGGEDSGVGWGVEGSAGVVDVKGCVEAGDWVTKAEVLESRGQHTCKKIDGDFMENPVGESTQLVGTTDSRGPSKLTPFEGGAILQRNKIPALWGVKIAAAFKSFLC